MSELQNIFNNREIALGIWIALAIIISIFIKPVKHHLKSVIPIRFHLNFIVFSIGFLLHLGLVIYFLYAVGCWSIALLKDTIFWIIFVELPIFAKTIQKAKDNHFFIELIKDNLAIAAIIEFVINFWTFDLITEIILASLVLLYAVTAQESKYFKVKQLLTWIFGIWGFVIIINLCKHLYEHPLEFFNLSTLQEFLFPVVLLLLNLPVVYGLALYNAYEQVFRRVKGDKIENIKMKWSIIKFSGIYLTKITAIRANLPCTTVISLTDNDMKKNLKKLKNRLSMRIGDNYMKRANYYIIWCLIGFLISILGIIICNSQVNLKDIITLNFTLNIPRIKEIITYICSSGIVFSFCLFIYSYGFRKRKNEEISQVKKYALHGLLYLIKRQYNMLQEFPPIDKPTELFVQYIKNAYDLKMQCDKDIVSFENLLTSLELDIIKQLHASVSDIVFSIGINETEINQYSTEQFHSYYLEKKSNALQNEQTNLFVYKVQMDINKYSKQIKLCNEAFKRYF